MNNRFYKIIIFLISVLLIGLLSSCSNSVAQRLKDKHKIVLPKEFTLEYEIKETGWSGDGTAFYVVKLNNSTEFFEQFINHKAPMDFSDSFKTPFCSQKDSDFEKLVDNRINTLLEKIPYEYLPTWDVEYSWKNLGSLFMVYYSDNDRLFLFENL